MVMRNVCPSVLRAHVYMCDTCPWEQTVCGEFLVNFGGGHTSRQASASVRFADLYVSLHARADPSGLCCKTTCCNSLYGTHLNPNTQHVEHTPPPAVCIYLNLDTHSGLSAGEKKQQQNEGKAPSQHLNHTRARTRGRWGLLRQNACMRVCGFETLVCLCKNFQKSVCCLL